MTTFHPKGVKKQMKHLTLIASLLLALAVPAFAAAPAVEVKSGDATTTVTKKHKKNKKKAEKPAAEKEAAPAAAEKK